MKKILIADDELIVRLGLKTTINWQANGFQIVGEASNGKEAIEMFEKTQPDILITDIKMPLIDGLDLIKTLKQTQKSFKAVILSHYDDFCYARNAINLGASEYVLKAELTAEKLLNVLHRLSEQIDKERKFDIQNNAVNPAINDPSQAANQRYSFFQNIIEKNLQNKDSILKYISEMQDSMGDRCFVVICSSPEYPYYHTILDDSAKLFYSIDSVARNILYKKSWEHTLFISNNKIYFLLSHSKAKVMTDDYRDTIHTLKNNLEQYHGTRIIFGVSSLENEPTILPQMCEQAELAWSACYFSPEKLIFYSEEFKNTEQQDFLALDSDLLRNGLKSGDETILSDYLNEVFNELKSQRNIDSVRNVFIDAVSLVKIFANEFQLIGTGSLSAEKFDYDVFDKLTCFDELCNYVLDLYSLVARIAKGEITDKENYSHHTLQCISYIKKNFSNPISLTDMSDYVGISKCYLSLLFRQDTGTTVTNYLTNYRIIKAKKMLEDTNMKTYEIADAVGFDNPYYFSKVFKDITGESCRSYKNKRAQTG